jgi:hypothetical protein
MYCAYTPYIGQEKFAFIRTIRNSNEEKIPRRDVISDAKNTCVYISPWKSDLEDHHQQIYVSS